MAFVWRTAPGGEGITAGDNSPTASSDPANLPTSPTQLLASRIIISTSLALGALYFVLVVRTFTLYGDRIDRRWRENVHEQMRHERELKAREEYEMKVREEDERKAWEEEELKAWQRMN